MKFPAENCDKIGEERWEEKRMKIGKSGLPYWVQKQIERANGTLPVFSYLKKYSGSGKDPALFFH